MQLEVVDSLISIHQENAKIYEDLLEGSKFEYLDQNYASPNNWVYGCLVDDNRNIIKQLRLKQIDSSAIHLRNDNYTIFKNDLNINQHLPGVDEFSRRFIAIPCGSWLSDNDKKHIKTVLTELN